MYNISGLGGVSVDDITHNVNPLLNLAEYGKLYCAEICGAGPTLKRYRVNGS